MTIKHIVSTIYGCLVLFALGCEKDAPTQSTETDPLISAHSVPDKIKQSSSAPVNFMIRAEDPQGLANLGGVSLRIVNQGALVLEGDMFDNGESGDIISGDGVFTYSFVPNSITIPVGTLSIIFQAADIDGNLSLELDANVTVEEGGGGIPPRITSVELPQSLIIDRDIDFAIIVQAEDEDGDLDGIELQIFPASSRQPILTDTLRSIDNDETFIDSLNTMIFTQIESDYFFRFEALDRAGNKSVPAVNGIHIKRIDRNDPPQVLIVSARDTVSKSGQTDFLLAAEVTDPQGREDIAQVILNSFKPDGSAATGNPFFLRDDAIGGDLEPDDGIYSLRFGFDQSNENGTYRFEVHATDRAGATSNIVIHFITLID
jgi:hypothetical protein